MTVIRVVSLFLLLFLGGVGFIEASITKPDGSIRVRQTLLQNSLCTVDISETPAMSEFAQNILVLCKKNYKKIKKKLILDSFEPPKQVSLVFKKKVCSDDEKECYPAVTVGNRILLSEEYFKKNPNDLGAIVHELAHVVQSYPNDSPGWLREGIADYIRYSRGYQSETSYPHCRSPQYSFYDSGYWCSAAFLGYVNKKYGGKIIGQLNQALRENRYSDALFAIYTKKTIDKLWKDCLNEECKGGIQEKIAVVNSSNSNEETINPVFLFTPDQLLRAFSSSISAGHRKLGGSFGQQQTLVVSAAVPFNPSSSERLEMTISFLSPIAQAEKDGYHFGEFRAGSTTADRSASENGSVYAITRNKENIVFNVKLKPPRNKEAVIPRISFSLVDSKGERISPTQQPEEYTSSDLMTAAGLEEQGQDLIFALKNGTKANVTNKMEKMTLIVLIGGDEQTLEFRLK